MEATHLQSTALQGAPIKPKVGLKAKAPGESAVQLRSAPQNCELNACCRQQGNREVPKSWLWGLLMDYILGSFGITPYMGSYVHPSYGPDTFNMDGSNQNLCVHHQDPRSFAWKAGG